MSNQTDKDILDENRLVSLLKQGNEEAFSTLVRRYSPRLFSIAYGITLDREESLDIAQDVFLKVHRHIKTFKGKAGLSTWLHRITVNQSLNWKRRCIRRLKWHHQPFEENQTCNIEEHRSNTDNPETLYRKKELELLFKKGLKELPEDARVVFTLKEIEGLSYAEIAKVLKIKHGTVSSRLFYARKRLKELIGQSPV